MYQVCASAAGCATRGLPRSAASQAPAPRAQYARPSARWGAPIGGGTHIGFPVELARVADLPMALTSESKVARSAPLSLPSSARSTRSMLHSLVSQLFRSACSSSRSPSGWLTQERFRTRIAATSIGAPPSQSRPLNATSSHEAPRGSALRLWHVRARSIAPPAVNLHIWSAHESKTCATGKWPLGTATQLANLTPLRCSAPAKCACTRNCCASVGIELLPTVDSHRWTAQFESILARV